MTTFGKRTTPPTGSTSDQPVFEAALNTFRAGHIPTSEDAAKRLSRQQRVKALLESEAEEVIVFERVYPPSDSTIPKSFLGGVPRLAPGITWPMVSPFYPGSLVRAAGMNFLAQIDLSSLPAVPGRSKLPAVGTLYFFANTDFGNYLHEEFGSYGRVFYSPMAAYALPSSSKPSRMMPCEGGSWHYQHAGLTEADAPTIYNQWEITPRRVVSYPDAHPNPGSSEEAEEFQRQWQALQGAALASVFGPPARREIQGFFGTTPIKRTPFLFPFSWRCVEVFAAKTLRRVEDMHRWRPAERSGSGADLRLLDDLKQWYARARAAGADKQLKDTEVEEFWIWLDSFDWKERSRLGMQDALYFSLASVANSYLSQDVSIRRLVPPELESFLKHQHSVISEGSFANTTLHQMFGHGKGIQSEEFINRDKILLLQLDSDYGIEWMWGDLGCLKFWISPEDLAAQRFDKAFMTLEGH